MRVKAGSPAKLGALLRASKRAQKKLDAASQAASLANDALLVANDAAWRMILAAYGMAQANAKTAPEVLQSFDFLGEAFARPAAAAPVRPDAAPTSATPH